MSEIPVRHFVRLSILSEPLECADVACAALSPCMTAAAILSCTSELRLFCIKGPQKHNGRFIEQFSLEGVIDFCWISSISCSSLSFLACTTQSEVVLCAFSCSSFSGVSNAKVSAKSATLGRTNLVPPVSDDASTIGVSIYRYQATNLLASLTRGTTSAADEARVLGADFVSSFRFCESPFGKTSSQTDIVYIIAGKTLITSLRLGYGAAPLLSVDTVIQPFRTIGSFEISHAIVLASRAFILDSLNQTLRIWSLQRGTEQIHLDLSTYWATGHTANQKFSGLRLSADLSMLVLFLGNAASFFCICLEDLFRRRLFLSNGASQSMAARLEQQLHCTHAFSEDFYPTTNLNELNQAILVENLGISVQSHSAWPQCWESIESLGPTTFDQRSIFCLDPRQTSDSAMNCKANSFCKAGHVAASSRVDPVHDSSPYFQASPALQHLQAISLPTEMSANDTGSATVKWATDTQDPSLTVLVRGDQDRILIGPYDTQTVIDVVVTPSKLIALVQTSASQLSLYSVGRDGSQEEHVVPLEAPIIPLSNGRICGLYFLCTSSLQFYLPGGIGEDHLTNGLIIFEHPALADELYALNGWDRRTLRLHTLRLGLQYRQIDVIQPALLSLDEDQQLLGCKMLLEFIRVNMRLILDELFWNELLQRATQFVAAIISRKSRIYPKSASANILMNKFSKILTTIRKYKTDVSTITKGALTGAHLKTNFVETHHPALFTSPFSVQKARSRIGKPASVPVDPHQKLGKSLAIDLFGASETIPNASFASPRLPASLSGSQSSPVGDRQSPPSPQTDRELPSSSTSQPSSADSSGGGHDSMTASRTIPSLFDSDKLDCLEDMSAAFLNSKDRWEKMHNVEIIADALVTSHISLALSFLRWRSRQFANGFTGDSVSWKYLKDTAYQLFYQVATHGQFNLCRKMITSLGESPEHHFAHVAFSTANQDIRALLLDSWAGPPAIPQLDDAVFSFSKILEEHYSCTTTYSFEFVRKSLAPSGAKAGADLVETTPFHPEFQCADLEDFIPPPEMDLRLDGGVGATSSQRGAWEPAPSTGYAWWRLRWLKEAIPLDSEFISRVVLERNIIKGSDEWKPPTGRGNDQNEILATVSYLIQHADSSRLLEILETIYCRSAALYIADERSVLAEIARRAADLPRSLGRDVVHDSLSRRRSIFDEASIQSVDIMFVRLARLNSLFPGLDPEDSPKRVLGDSSLLFYCLQFCIDAKMPALLQAFLDGLNLARDYEEILRILKPDDKLSLKAERTWVKSIFVIRNEEHFFDASLLNAKMCLESKRSLSVQLMLNSSNAKEKRPFMALTSLLYAPVSLKDALEAPKDKLWHVERRTWFDFLGKFTTLRDSLISSTAGNSCSEDNASKVALHEHETSASQPKPFVVDCALRDISLHQLISESTPFDLKWLFHGDSNAQHAENEHSCIPSFSGVAFDRMRFVDKADATFYLTRGEPVRAFQLILSGNRTESFKIPIAPVEKSDATSSHISLSEMSQIYQTVRAVAIEHLSDPAVVSACVGLLELCDVNTEELRIDIETLTRIVCGSTSTSAAERTLVLHLTNQQQATKDLIPTNDLLAHTLSRLEVATLTLISQRACEPHSSEVLALWQLVVQFCSSHRLAPYLRPMIILAQRDDWIGLLKESQVFNYLPSCILPVAAQHPRSTPLRDHLIICLRLMCKQSLSLIHTSDVNPNLTTATAGIAPNISDRLDLLDPQDPVVCQTQQLSGSSSDVFKFIRRAAKRVYFGESLLEFAVKFEQPLLTVAASNLPDTCVISCILGWLYSAISDASATFGELYLSFDVTMRGFHLPVQENQTQQAKAFQQVFSLLFDRNEKFLAYARRALEIIDPGNPLLALILFRQAIHQSRYRNARSFLDIALSRLDESASPSRAPLSREFMERIIIDLCTSIVLHKLPTPFERRECLRILADSGLSRTLSTLFQHISMMERLMMLPAQFGDEFTPPSAQLLLDELLARSKFDVGRRFAIANGLDETLVTIREAEWLLAESQRRGTFEMSDDRLNTFKQVDSLFSTRHTSLQVAGKFFFLRAAKLGCLLASSPFSGMNSDLNELPGIMSLQELPMSMTVLDAAKEHVVLLQLARAWLEGTHSTSNRSESLQRNESLIREIDEQILRSSVLIQAESGAVSSPRLLGASTKGSTFTPTADTRGSRQVLDEMIGKLLNTDQLDEAVRVSSQLQHQSRDIIIVQTMLKYAKSSELDLDKPISIDSFGLPSALVELLLAPLRGKTSETSHQSSQLKMSTLELLDKLGRLARHARECCDRILVRVKSCRLLNISFDTLLQFETTAIAAALLAKGPEHLLLFKHFIQVSNVQPEELAVLIGSICFLQILEIDSGATVSSNAGLSAQNTTQVKQGPPFWSPRHFNDYLDLTQTPALVGDELMRLWQEQSSHVSPTNEVEIIIRAFMAFRRAQDMQRQNKLFATIKERVQTYVKNKNLRLLVRLVTGMKQYSRLSYVLDLLIKFDSFEMLLSKNNSVDDEDDRRELAISLYNFLKSNYPSHTEKMKLLFFRFTMYREYADVLQERAWAALNSTKARLEPSYLLQAMDLFLEAAVNYAKEKAFVLERKCLDMARLVDLQFELADCRIVNLKPDQALSFVSVWPEFHHCFIVACAYGTINSAWDWVDVLHQQVVIAGNFNFLEDFLATVEVEDTTELFSKIVRKFRADQVAGVVPSGRVGVAAQTHLRRLVDYIEDCHIKFSFAQEMGMPDLVDSLVATVPGIDYFVQIPGTNSLWMHQPSPDEVSLD